jgi:secondary thiamine-phosphate synthase enzyme
MLVVTRRVNVDTNAAREEHYVAVINITPQIHQQAAETFVTNGTVTIFLPGTTAAITTIELEEGLVSDFQKMWARIVPRDIVYKHKFMWEENNGFSHVRASLMGPSLVVPLVNKRLVLGQFQQVVLVEFDNRARSRQVVLQFMGEQA